MIVIGIDPHMKTHTAVAIDAVTGAALGERTVSSDAAGHDELLAWARGLGRRAPLRHRGLPPRLGQARAPPAAPRRARRARAAQADGRRAALGAHLRQVRPHRRRVRGPRRAARAGSARGVVWRGPNTTCACSPITATTSLTSANASRSACAGTATTWSSTSSCRPGRWTATCGSTGSRRPCWRCPQTTRRRIALEQLARCRELTVEIRALEREIREPDARARSRAARDPRLLGAQRGAPGRPDGRRLALQRRGGLRHARRRARRCRCPRASRTAIA